MNSQLPTYSLRDPSSELAFNAWFSQALRNIYEPVMHEALPAEIVDLLNDTPEQS